MIGGAIGSVGRPQQRTQSVMRYPAPLMGIDTRKSLTTGDLNNCVYTFNLCPFEFGLRCRSGFREWQIAVDAGIGAGVHTLIPFDSIQDSGAGDKLFAVTNEGIWDTTVYAAAPVKVATFTDTSADAGYGTFTHYVNQAEDDVLFYADNLNGLWSYDAGLNAWTQGNVIDAGQPITDADVKFVMSHKNNVWFAAQNSTIGYYLPILANQGVVTEQFFGDKFGHGGTLEGLFSWTVDGGDGVDDILVAVSHAGDVILYTGSGPDEADWGMKGIYYIGQIPNTPRFGSEQGGELYLLSAYGIVSMSDLLSGVDSNTLQADVEGNSIALKISGLLRQEMREKITLRGWDVSVVPAEGGIVVSTPTVGAEAPIQFYYNLATRGWGLWRNVPMTCFTEWEGAVMFGTADNRVQRMDDVLDNVVITPEAGTENGEPIGFSIMTSYSPLSGDGTYKRVKLIRPDFISTTKPTFSSQARYDFDTSEAFDFATSDPNALAVGVWDLGAWDNVIWASKNGTTFPTIAGAWGTGRYIAVATAGTCRADTRLIGWDVIFDAGGTMI